MARKSTVPDPDPDEAVKAVSSLPPGAIPSMSLKTLRGIVRSVEKKVGADSISLYDPNDPIYSIPYWISTGAPDLDQKLGGGIAGGRVIEIFSKAESEGKSSVAATIARECQFIGGSVVWFDSEHTILPEHFKKFGLNVGEISFTHSQTLEKFFETVEVFSAEFREAAIKDGIPKAPLLFVLDSVAAAQTVSQEEANYDKAGVAAQARVMSASLRKLIPHLARTQATLILVNQSRKNIAVMYGDDNITPGGQAMKFYASQRIALRKTSTKLTNERDELVGIEVEAHIVKNKVAQPFKKSGFRLIFESGVSYPESAFDLLNRRGVILGGKDTAGRYTFPGVLTGTFYKKDFPTVLAEHPEIRGEVAKQVSIPETSFNIEVDPEFIDPNQDQAPE